MSKYRLISSIYGVWVCFSVLGIILSVTAHRVLVDVAGFESVGRVEVYSAVWVVILGLAIKRVQNIFSGEI